MTDANNSITVLTWSRNEAIIMPFFLRHYAEFADKIIVWDNGSTDGTQAIVKSHPKAELRNWDTGGIFDEIAHTDVKSKAYRDTGPGWKIVVDTDEFVWHKHGIRRFLQICSANSWNIAPTKGFDMISESMPDDDGKTQLTDLVKEGIWSPRYCKPAVFNGFLDIQYYHGCHGLKSIPTNIFSAPTEIFLLHYRWLCRDNVVNRARWMGKVFNKEQLGMGLGTESINVQMQMSRYNFIWENRKRILQ